MAPDFSSRPTTSAAAPGVKPLHTVAKGESMSGRRRRKAAVQSASARWGPPLLHVVEQLGVGDCCPFSPHSLQLGLQKLVRLQGFRHLQGILRRRGSVAEP